MPDLFAAADEARRKELIARGWTHLPGDPAHRCWVCPEGDFRYSEDEAFAWLARAEAAEAKGGPP